MCRNVDFCTPPFIFHLRGAPTGRVPVSVTSRRLLLLLPGLIELLFHSRIHVSKFADSQILNILIGKPEIVLRTEKIGLQPLKFGDSLVYVLDGTLEFFSRS